MRNLKNKTKQTNKQQQQQQKTKKRNRLINIEKNPSGCQRDGGGGDS